MSYEARPLWTPRFSRRSRRRCATPEESARTPRLRRQQNSFPKQVNFAYDEAGEEKNALVKVRVCPECEAQPFVSVFPARRVTTSARRRHGVPAFRRHFRRPEHT